METELVTFKMEQGFLKDVDETVKMAGFQNRTEFIRAALREKVEGIKLKQAMMELGKMKGKSSVKTGEDERAAIREKVFEEFERHFK